MSASTPSAFPSVTMTPTVAAASTPSLMPGARLEVQCLDIVPSIPVNLKSEGILILKEESSPDAFLMSMKTGDLVELLTPEELQSGKSADSFIVSPDRKWFAYWASKWVDYKYYGGNYVIAKNNGSLYKILDDITYQLLGWLDDEHIVFRVPVLIPTSDAYPIPRGDMTVVPPLLILNPFTGERRILEPDIPDLVPWVGNIPWWDGWSGLIYDPTLRYAAYLGEGGLVLRDLEDGRKIASAYFDVYSRPYWSPDGTRFAVADDLSGERTTFEIYTMDLNGQVTQLSNLGTYYPNDSISNLIWSPDGRYIAFQLMTWNEEGQDSSSGGSQLSLAVLDTTNGEVVNYCIPIIFSGLSYHSTPLWSPDGTQIIVEDQYSVDSSRVILVDLELGLAVQVVENMTPVGWMVEP